SRDGDLVLGEALGAQVAGELLAPTRGEPDAEALRGLAVEAALAQEVPAGPCLRGVEQGVVVELLGDAVGLDQACTPPQRLAVPSPGPAALLVVQLHAELLGQALHGLGEGEVLDLLDE